MYERIRRLRIEKGMSQGELAEKSGFTSRSSISKIEKGQRDIRQGQISAIAKALGVSPAYLMDGEDIVNSFGDTLKALRNQRGLTQQELADALGVSRSAIANYEAGDREPSFELAESIAEMFYVSLDELVGHQQIDDYFESFKKEQLKQALFGTIDATDDMLQEVMDYARFVKERKW